MGLFDFLKGLLSSKKTKKKKARRKTKKRTTRRPKGVRKKTKKKIKKKIRKRTKRIRKRVKKKVRKTPLKKLKKTLRKPSKKIPQKLQEKEIGVVTHYFGGISVAAIKLKDNLRVGDKIHIKGANDDFTQTVKSMQLNHKDINFAPKGVEVGIKITHRVHGNDKVYKAS